VWFNPLHILLRMKGALVFDPDSSRTPARAACPVLTTGVMSTDTAAAFRVDDVGRA